MRSNAEARIGISVKSAASTASSTWSSRAGAVSSRSQSHLPAILRTAVAGSISSRISRGLSGLPLMSHQRVSDPCGSQSSIATWWPSLAAWTASAAVIEDLPEPPFVEAIAIVCGVFLID